MSRAGDALGAPLAFVATIKAKLGLVVLVAVGAGLGLGLTGIRFGFRMRWSLLLAVAVAVAVVQLLARGMTAPLREMAAASRRMAGGEHGVRVAVRGRDEVGQLAAAFNSMSTEVEKVDAQRRRLVADASHELRTPIAALQALLENLADGVTEPDPVALDLALTQTQRLGRVVAQLLDLSRLEAGEVPLRRSRVVVGDLAEQAAAEARAHCLSLGRPVAVLVDVEAPGGQPLTVDADPERLAQVLANLLDNATRHAPTGGCVEAVGRRTASGVRLEVLDDGPGIAPQLRERVFDRFARTDDSRSSAAGGTGLGLAIVRWVVELHGGSVRVGEPPGSTVHGDDGGCRFVVDLPDRPA